MIDLSWSCFRQARIYVNKIQFCWSFYSTAKQFHVFQSWSPLTIIARLHIAANCKIKQKHGKERIFHQELTINLLFLLFLFLVGINWKAIEINSKTLACVSARRKMVLLCFPGKWFLLIDIQIFLCLAPYSGFYSSWIVLGIVVGSLNFRLVPKKCLGFCLGLGLRLGDGIGVGLRSGMESYRFLQAAHRLLSHIQVAQPASLSLNHLK